MSDIHSNHETETTESSSGNENHKYKNEVPLSLEEKLKELPEVLDYIRTLEKNLKRQKKKLKKIKSKLKKTDQPMSVAVQTEDIIENEAPKSIADEIKEAAELAMQNTGFVYDESSGLYYDSNTGYYYNAEYGLYYEASTGTYLSYKQETNTYEFHSRVHVPRSRENHNTKEVVKRKKKSSDELKAPKCVRMDIGDNYSPPSETEEGECSRSSGSESDDTNNTDNSDITKQWPPCMRIIVEQLKTPKIRIGSLHILTFEGGTLGREGNHSILLPDINISKCHLKFTFDKESNGYLVADLGSRNGTILNGKRMSSSKQESEPFEVAHGSRIQVGSIVLLCHIHDGNKTCGHCEPGLVQITEKKVEVPSKLSKTQKHRTELKNLRKKFGVSAFEEDNTKLALGYTDRAQKRRQTVGSQNHHEKTEVASLNESISSKNKGFKMLAKMGWKEGQSLGKDSQGLLEPVKLVSNPGTSGIGNPEALISNNQPIDTNKQMIWKKTQERFKQLPNNANVFEESD